MSETDFETFVEACLSGSAFLDDIDDWVARWHEADRPADLDMFLGFTSDEGALWTERPEALRFIVAAHRYDVRVADVLQGRDDYALAARTADSEAATGVLDWLRQVGRVQ